MPIRLLPNRRLLVMTRSTVAVYDIPEPQSFPSVSYQEGTSTTIPCWTMSYERPPTYFSLEISPILSGDMSFHFTNGWVLYTVVMPDDGSANFNIAQACTFDSTQNANIVLGTQWGVSWLRAGPGPQTEMQCWSYGQYRTSETTMFTEGLIAPPQRVRSSTLSVKRSITPRCMFLDDQSGRLVISARHRYVVMDFA